MSAAPQPLPPFRPLQPPGHLGPCPLFCPLHVSLLRLLAGSFDVLPRQGTNVAVVPASDPGDTEAGGDRDSRGAWALGTGPWPCPGEESPCSQGPGPAPPGRPGLEAGEQEG